MTLLAILSFAAPSSAQGVSTLGGMEDCGQWFEGRTKGKSSAIAIENYAIGVLNGLSIGHAVEFWHADGREISSDAVFLWLDNYCRNHPLDPVLTGIMALYEERSGLKPEK